MISPNIKKFLWLIFPLLMKMIFYVFLHKKFMVISTEKSLTLTNFLELASAVNYPDTPIVLLDEAQLYSSALMEKIRLISDARALKFVITLHKTDDEDIIAKEHFQTRIWESIELQNASPEELKIYIQKKFLKANCFDVANMINDKNIKLITKLTKGNYRDTNKLMFSLFSLYAWYEEHHPTKLNTMHLKPNGLKWLQFIQDLFVLDIPSLERRWLKYKIKRYLPHYIISVV